MLIKTHPEELAGRSGIHERAVEKGGEGMKRNGIAGILAAVCCRRGRCPLGRRKPYKLDPVLVTAEKRTETCRTCRSA